MKNMLYRFIIFGLLLCTQTKSTGQLIKVDLDEKITNAPLIVEGRVINRKSFWNQAHTMIYTSNRVEVYKLFKGNTVPKTIEIITQGGSVGLEYVEASDLLQLENSQTGIFFCEPNRINIRSPFTNAILFDVYSSDQGFLRYDLQKDEAYAPFANYKNIEAGLYTEIEKKCGGTYKLINPSFNISAAISKANQVVQGPAGAQATISSFAPSTVHAGALLDAANNVLTINGSGFGSTPSGSAGIRFTDGSPSNANIDLFFTVPYKSFYVISWTDTKIVVKVPARAATGNFGVVTSNGSVEFAASPLIVSYAILNATFLNLGGYDSVFAETRMVNTNNAGGYTILYSTNTAGGGKNFFTSTEKETFARALNTWKEQVGVNFTEGGTTTLQQVRTSDDKNVIMFDNANTGNLPLQAGVLATTYNKFLGCVIGNVVYASQKSEFDVVIRNPGVSVGNTSFTTGPCFPANNDIDLETTILHELGHAINLGHINDTYEGNTVPNVNAAKLMHYQIVNYVTRRSLDNSAYTGGLYACQQLNADYGVCTGLFASEMTPLNYITIPNDECPLTFPTAATPDGTSVIFDLAHATSNLNKDPQFTAVNCTGNGTSVTNNGWYVYRTAAGTNKLSLYISGYTTTPASQAACTGQGVRVSVYDLNTCPDGQNFPAPIACVIFTTNGPIADITGLQANHNYVLYFDGLRNTKASFVATINGLPANPAAVTLTGQFVTPNNELSVAVAKAGTIQSLDIERSADNIVYNQLSSISLNTNIIGTYNYADASPLSGNNYYRIKITNTNSTVEYSNVLLLSNSAGAFNIFPNPVYDKLNINFNVVAAGEYQSQVFNMMGQLLLTQKDALGTGTQTIRLPFINLASGMYFIKLSDSEGNIITKQKVLKLIK
ncbi:T9SS type A sorting domain-containing protein [Limnovirga soli]|uniref:T9SS type A sorting domain-containing protein n=1 Tax=Limnovirga soli TaxID=2656915 RepID=A0A8J8FH79_9BACT|nr:T9SS type A sorting domain-containing protein [Limnovirga soli]NNV58020.1 T9SS type A sorting domain-containing protein [Limnovirga soli]